MRSLHALIALFVLAFAVVALDACATGQTATKKASKKHRSTKAKAASPQSPTSVAVRDDVESGEEDGEEGEDAEDGDDGEARKFDDVDLTALSVSEGGASYYHDSLAGRVTANGEKYDPEMKTCAHRSLPFGTVLVVENVASGKKSSCRVNDRGPFVGGRLIDVSKQVAKDLGMISRGVIRVRIRVAKPPTAS